MSDARFQELVKLLFFTLSHKTRTREAGLEHLLGQFGRAPSAIPLSHSISGFKMGMLIPFRRLGIYKLHQLLVHCLFYKDPSNNSSFFPKRKFKLFFLTDCGMLATHCPILLSHES